jgi:penicillin-binding protein 1A
MVRFFFRWPMAVCASTTATGLQLPKRFAPCYSEATSQMKTIYQEAPPVEVAGGKVVGRVLFGLLVLTSAVVGAGAGLLLVYTTDLPQVEALEAYRPSSITELYDDHGRVIGSFALQRRVVAGYEDFAPVLRDALISIEDKDFYKHSGINFFRIVGAAYRDLQSGGKVQGASTLTMQLARNLFLSPDRSFHRKVQETMLAIQIERRFTKPQIFTLYANEIFLGHGVYGFEAASEYYFSKPARQLTLTEASLLAGLPKGPGFFSPINHPERAMKRRNLVIDAMLEDGKITAAQANNARLQPLVLRLAHDPNSLAPYFVEETRRYLENKYGADQVHEGGLRVYTSLDVDLQRAANRAVLDGVAAYERRHGWKGHLENVVAEGNDIEKYQHPDWDDEAEVNGYVHALVTSSGVGVATLRFGRYSAAIGQADVGWTQGKIQNLLKAGDICYVKILSLNANGAARVTLEQDSGAQGALVTIDNTTGGIEAMVGGRDFNQSKFDRATQALRQVGSSFKPYVYTTVIDKGGSPDDTILDEPVTFESGSGPYTPHNYDEKFEGMITLRRALAQSRNIPALKLASKVGIKSVIEYAERFGITAKLPPYLPVALGSAEITLMEQTSAYSVFPNDGVRVTPRYITKVTDYEGRVLEENYPEVKDVINSHTARVMTSMLREVVLHGTGVAASKLPFPVAGKTGTTNDFTDAWFVGFSPNMTCGVWVGFDEKKSLGAKETGARAALPIWMDFMSSALAGKDPGQFQPVGDVAAAVGQKVDTPDNLPGADETH